MFVVVLLCGGSLCPLCSLWFKIKNKKPGHFPGYCIRSRREGADDDPDGDPADPLPAGPGSSYTSPSMNGYSAVPATGAEAAPPELPAFSSSEGAT